MCARARARARASRRVLDCIGRACMLDSKAEERVEYSGSRGWGGGVGGGRGSESQKNTGKMLERNVISRFDSLRR